MSLILDGKKVSQNILEELKVTVEFTTQNGRRPPHLAAILVGEDPPSLTYVENKVKACDKVGIRSTLFRLPALTGQDELLKLIQELNNQTDLDGILVQLPLPKSIDETAVIETISPFKDVDGFHPINIGRMTKNLSALLPATPSGILELLRRYEIPTVGKHCVVVGRSNIVGSPISILMSQNNSWANSTVTLCHSKTQNLEYFTRQADILIVAIGKPHFFNSTHIKEGAVVIDVGIHRIQDNTTKSGFKLCGDVDFESVSGKVYAITPVPGGVGPLTIAGLLQNTVKSWQNTEN
jgi:methylenetetrahydrofolate dehydrogenase (NADP+)/methenyltetrahydrofolate cyclohydrolase